MPNYIHSDRGANFLSDEVATFLRDRGIATSHTSGYNPRGNGQIERYNGVIWNTVCLALKSRNLKVHQWEIVLTDVLHCIRSLLCTATNCTPHERMFSHQRRTSTGGTVPTWLTTPGPVLMKRHNRASKYEPAVEEVELIKANPQYAWVKHPSGRESTVSLRDLALRDEKDSDIQLLNKRNDLTDKSDIDVLTQNSDAVTSKDLPQVTPRRSTRTRKSPERLVL